MRTILLALFAILLASLQGCVSVGKGNSAVEDALTPTGEKSERYRARLATELAASYLQRQQYSIALEELANATTYDSNYSPAYNVMGLVYHGLSEDIKAEEAFRRATRIDPNNAEAHNNFGWFLCRTKRERESLDAFELALKNPLYNTPELALFSAATCSQRIGLIKIAEQYYKRLLEVSPNTAVAYYGLLDIAYKTARYSEAKAFMQSAFNLSEAPAKVLWQGICVAKKMSDKQAELTYLNQLSTRYAESTELRRARNGDCD
jgi:type IV pilus assembly protein PilF